MTKPKTGGRIRGFISRWLVRFEASQGILQMVALAITAASTLTSALVAVGYGSLAPYILAAGTVGAPAFAYAYVELGVFNRKNRERMDRGDNFSGPGMYMSGIIQGGAFGAALDAHARGDDPEEAAREYVQEHWAEFRNGVDMTQLAEENGHAEEVDA